MKQTTNLLKRIFLLVSFFTACTLFVSAADFMEDSICYNIIGDNEVEVASRDIKYSGEVIIPASVVHDGTVYQVTRIGNNAFNSCFDLTSVDIPEGIKEIGNYAFAYCRNLSFVEFPNSLEKIDLYAFYYCQSITSFYITRNVKEMGWNPFTGCLSVTDFMCSGNNAYYKSVNGVLFSKDMTDLVAYPPASTATTYDIPESVTSILLAAFSHSSNLKQVNIPESVTWVGPSAFLWCSGLESLVFPDGITYIGPSGVASCTNLTYLHLPANLDTIHNSTVYGLKSLTELTVPRTVRYIDNYAFTESSGLKTITFEEGSCLEGIGQLAFDHCTSLETFDMPNTVTTIAGQVFGNCTSLKYAHLSDNLTSMGGATFWECTSMVEGEIPGGVSSIRNAFVNCTALKRLKLGSKDSAPGTTLIKNVGITGCDQLERIELGANIDSLENLALMDLQNVKVFICWASTPPRCNDHWSCFSPSTDRLTAPLYVPKASIEAYRTAYQWKDFQTIVPIEDVGDVNDDGNISIADVTALIDVLLNGQSITLPLADVNLDGDLSIGDVTDLIDRLLSNN